MGNLEFEYESWKTWNLNMGHGKPGMWVWVMENLEFEYGSWKIWNVSMGHGKPGMWVWVMENLEFEYGSWKTWNVSMGHGKPGIWIWVMENLECEYGSWKTWNVSMGHGKPGIWVWVMESLEFEYGSWKVTENDYKWFFSKNNKARNTSNEWSFSHYFENNFSNFRSWETKKSPGKGHRKSWNFIRSKEYEAWHCLECGAYGIVNLFEFIICSADTLCLRYQRTR